MGRLAVQRTPRRALPRARLVLAQLQRGLGGSEEGLDVLRVSLLAVQAVLERLAPVPCVREGCSLIVNWLL